MHHPFWQPAALIEELTLESNVLLPDETSRSNENKTANLIREVRGKICRNGST
jgi:hypothetical protein